MPPVTPTTGGPVDGYHLYRFPIILPTDSWLANMPHGLKCYTRSELVYWSEYGPDGNRYCETHGTVETDPKNQRARRVFGGRPVVVRGMCEPNACPEYQASKCKLSGQLLFYVPGAPGSSAIALATTSFYSLQQMRQQMEMVAFIRGGKISGVLNGKPLFYLTKKYEDVSMLDENGQAKKVKQWLIHLEANIDMTRLFRESEPNQVLADGATAAQVLTHQPAQPAVLPGPLPEPTEPEAADEPGLLEQVERAVAAIGIDTTAFALYAEAKFGGDWKTDEDTLQVLLAELAEAQEDPQAFAEKVAAQDCPF